MPKKLIEKEVKAKIKEATAGMRMAKRTAMETMTAIMKGESSDVAKVKAAVISFGKYNSIAVKYKAKL